jgi:hypothetical protein
LLSRLGGGLSPKFLGQGAQRHRDRIVLIDDFRREPAALFCGGRLIREMSLANPLWGAPR